MVVSFKKNFLKDIFILGGYSYSSNLIGFLSSIVLARLLLPEEYGVVAMITVFTNFIMIFSDAGLGADIIRSNYGTTYYKAMFNLSLLIGILLFLFMCLLAYPLALFYGNMQLILPTILISTQFIFRGMSLAHCALIMKKLKFSFIGKLDLYANIFMVALMILLAALNFSYWALIIPVVITEFIKYLLYTKYTHLPFKIYPFAYTLAAYSKARSIIWNITGVGIFQYWSKNMDKLLVGKQYGEASLGVYARGGRFFDLSLRLISRLFGTVLYPSLKKLEDNRGPVHTEYLSILGIISIINFPIAVILILLPESLVLFLWGANWSEAAIFLPYFALLILIHTMIQTMDDLFKLYRKEHQLLIISFVSATIMIIAIALGSMVSALRVAQYLTLFYLAVIMPFQLIYGFILTLGYSTGKILTFWGPKLILSNALLYAIWNHLFLLKIILLTTYLVHLVYFQWSDLIKLYYFTKEKLKRFIQNRR